MRDHLTQVWKTTGNKPRELEEASGKPEELGYLWDWFVEVKSGCGEHLTFSEVESWSRLSRRQIRGWEMDVLLALNRIVIKGFTNE